MLQYILFSLDFKREYLKQVEILIKKSIQKNCHRELIHLQEVVYCGGKTIESLK